MQTFEISHHVDTTLWIIQDIWGEEGKLVSLLARFQSNPGLAHWNVLLHVIGYIKNTLDYGLTYLRDYDLSPTAFVDVDYGGCQDTRCSISGFIFTMARGPVTWSSEC